MMGWRVDGRWQWTVVGSAHPGQATGHDLAALGHELLQQPHLFVVDVVDLLDAKLADLLAAEELASAVTGGAAIRSVGPALRARRRCWNFLVYFVSHKFPLDGW